MTVTTLVPRKPDADVVATLKAFLECAERGDIVQVAIIARGPASEEPETGYVGDPYTLAGMAEALKLELLTDD